MVIHINHVNLHACIMCVHKYHHDLYDYIYPLPGPQHCCTCDDRLIDFCMTSATQFPVNPTTTIPTLLFLSRSQPLPGPSAKWPPNLHCPYRNLVAIAFGNPSHDIVIIMSGCLNVEALSILNYIYVPHVHLIYLWWHTHIHTCMWMHMHVHTPNFEQT